MRRREPGGAGCPDAGSEAAEQTYRRALVLKEALLGSDNPDTALTAYNPGVLLLDMGRNDEATELIEGALRVFEGSLGADHPHTQIARYLCELNRASTAGQFTTFHHAPR